MVSSSRLWVAYIGRLSLVYIGRLCPVYIRATPDIVDQVREYAQKLEVADHLSAYRVALRVMKHPRWQGADYFLLKLDKNAKMLTVEGYKTRELEEASKEYLRAEEATGADQDGMDTVLVKVDSVRALRRAYPNYFLDSGAFLRELTRVMGVLG